MNRTVSLLGLAIAAAALAAGCALLRASPAGPAPGRGIVAAKCSACHPVPEPGSLTARRFDEALAAHARRVRLSAEERAALRSALVTDGGGQDEGDGVTGQ